MRLVHLTRDFPPRSTGGISTAVGGLSAALARAQHPQLVLSFDAWRPRRGVAGPVVPPRPTGSNPVVIRLGHDEQLADALSQAAAFGCDTALVHHGMLWPAARQLAERTGCRLVLVAHVLQAEQLAVLGATRSTISLRAQEEALAEAEVILAPSRFAAQALRARYPRCSERVRVIGWALPTAPASIGDPSSPPVLLMVGRLSLIKGSDTLVAAAPRMLAELPTARLVVVGGVPENPRAQRRWERDLAAIERLELTGWCDPAALRAWYRKARVVIIPSRLETFGLVALEAMHAGVPVVATTAGALPELISDGVTGRLVPPDDPAALAAAVLPVVRDPALALRYATAGQALVRREYCWDRRLPAIINALPGRH